MRKNRPVCSLKKRGDFKHVFGRGKNAAEPLLVVYALANDLGYHRLGLSVSKKVGGAVTRNRVKRWIKESCRFIFGQELEKQPGRSYDLIVIARAAAGQLAAEGAFAKISDTLSRLFARLGVLT